MAGKKQAESVDSKVLNRICSHVRGWVFTPDAFQDLGSRAAVDVALRRQKRAGTIRQLARGLYDYPANHPQLGLLYPSADAVAKALAGRDALRLQPSGAYAANLLGLSEQVPMRVVFLTSYGEPRNVSAWTDEKFARELGAIDYIKKTDDLDTLVRQIKAAIEEK